MNKKRAALRRGIRSLIRDTSRELADLEGRPHPADVPPVDAPSAASVEPAPWEAERNGEQPDVAPAGGHEEVVPGGRPADEVDALLSLRPPEAAAPDPDAPTPGAESRAAWIVGPEPVTPTAPAAASPPHAATPPRTAAPPRTPAPPPGSPPPAAKPSRETHPSGGLRASRPAKPRRDARRPAGRRSRRGRKASRPARVAQSEVAVNGVSPQQARARKGVCFAYFIDHQCWQVPDAYCNTALQVCAIRDCPVYHLHQDALERRFAGKFKHFW